MAERTWRNNGRNVDPEVAQLRALLGPLVRDGRHEEAEQVRANLNEAMALAEAKRVIERIRLLPPGRRAVLAQYLAISAVRLADEDSGASANPEAAS